MYMQVPPSPRHQALAKAHTTAAHLMRYWRNYVRVVIGFVYARAFVGVRVCVYVGVVVWECLCACVGFFL